MNKFLKIAIVLVGLVVSANAQLKGLGYDSQSNQVTARLAVSPNFVDVGLGMKFDSEEDSTSENFKIDVSAFYLGHLHEFGPVDTYFISGGTFSKLAQKEDNIVIKAFIGFQPEVTLLDHIVLSTKFGLNIPLAPSFTLETKGNAISIVEGANFKILF